jgi:hypothetical protein
MKSLPEPRYKTRSIGPEIGQLQPDEGSDDVRNDENAGLSALFQPCQRER